jgi:hypothetical protein
MTRANWAADSKENVEALTMGCTSGLPGASGEGRPWIARVEKPRFFM